MGRFLAVSDDQVFQIVRDRSAFLGRPPLPAAVVRRAARRARLRMRTVESIDFHFGFGGQSLFVSGHASRGTELHVPVAMNTEAETPATVIAARQSWGCAQTVALANHHNTYASRL